MASCHDKDWHVGYTCWPHVFLAPLQRSKDFGVVPVDSKRNWYGDDVFPEAWMLGPKQQAVTKQGLKPGSFRFTCQRCILIIILLNKVHLHSKWKIGGTLVWKRFRKISYFLGPEIKVWFGWPRRLFRNSTMCGWDGHDVAWLSKISMQMRQT